MRKILASALVFFAAVSSAAAANWQHTGTDNYNGRTIEMYDNVDTLRTHDWGVAMDVAYVTDMRGKNFTAIIDFGLNCETNDLQYSVPISMTLGGKSMDMSLEDRNALSAGIVSAWHANNAANKVDVICGEMGK